MESWLRGEVEDDPARVLLGSVDVKLMSAPWGLGWARTDRGRASRRKCDCSTADTRMWNKGMVF